MRKISRVAAMIAVVLLFTFVQIACQPAADTNRSESLAPANTNSGRETVDTASIEAELLRIENDWPRVIKEKDVAAIGRVEADDAIFIYPDGSVGNKQQDLNDIAGGALTVDAIEMSDLKVKVLNNDAAFVTGQTEFKNGKYKTPDGKAMDISGKYRFIDTFARRNGDWQLVAGISTKITATAAPTASPAAPTATKASPAMKPSPTMRTSPAGSPAVKAPTTTSSPMTKATP
ncbi:MAG TPA: nuclear transport factor 2 family protein [Pyrinomonadaceae bacterium]|nr:nuclear transport factor 2 family protein [Pyrinomonadaceae bacterium]